MSGSAEDSTLVIFQHSKPGGDVRRMVLAHLGRYAELGAEERACQFGDQLLASIAFVAPVLAAKTAVQPGRVSRPVCRFVRQCGIKAFRITECFYDWQL